MNYIWGNKLKVNMFIVEKLLLIPQCQKLKKKLKIVTDFSLPNTSCGGLKFRPGL